MPGPGWWAVVAVLAVLRAGEAQRTGVGKLLNVFNIVTFPNDACNNGEVYGSCYTGDTPQIFKQSFNNNILNTDNISNTPRARTHSPPFPSHGVFRSGWHLARELRQRVRSVLHSHR